MHQVLQYCTSVVRILLQVENLVLICLSTGWRLEAVASSSLQRI